MTLLRLLTLTCLTLAAALLCSAFPAAAEPAGSGATEGQPADGQQVEEEDEDTPDGGVTFFPGVRGISGKELERIIREREERKKEEERKERRYAPNRTQPESKPEPKPESKPEPKPAPATRTEPKSEPAPQPEPVESAGADDALDPALKGVELSDEARDFLKRLRLMTLRSEWLLELAGEFRADAEVDVKELGNEEFIQYLLQWTKRTTDETRQYQAALKLPLTVYQFVYGHAVGGIAYFREKRPEDLPEKALAVARADVERLKAVWTQCLLASAELYTRLRILNAAEPTYNVLLAKFPKDEAIRKSYAAFVAVRDAERPVTPPGVSTGTGTGRQHSPRKNPDGTETPAYQRRYGG